MSKRISRRQFNTALVASAATSAFSPFGIVRSQVSRLKVGVLLPRTGILGLFGQSSQKGADLAPDLIKDMLGVDIELLNADWESNVDTARTRAERLIQQGAHVLVGAWDSGATAAVAQVAEQRGVPLVINISSAPQITEQGYKFVFRNFPPAAESTVNALAMIGDLFRATNVAPRTAVHMHVNDTYGQSITKATQALLPRVTQLPFKIVDTISYDPTAKDLSIEVSKAKAANPDFVILVARLNDAILLRREVVKQRWNTMGIISIGAPAMLERQFYKVLGKLSEHCISIVPWYAPTAKLTKRVEAAFKKQNPNDELMFNGLNVGYTFEAILIAADAFKRARSADPKELTDALRRTNIAERMMLGDAIRFDDKGQVVGNGSGCLQNLSLKPTLVLPTNAAETKPVFPWPEFKRAR